MRRYEKMVGDESKEGCVRTYRAQSMRVKDRSLENAIGGEAGDVKPQ